MQLTDENIRTIARLARLRVADDRIEQYRSRLSHILDWIEQLNEVDTGDAQALDSVFVEEMPMRTDTINDGEKASKVLSNAPGGAKHDMFEVPKVVE
ncbi:MAG: Asp-tRNA(Asn)/Glu-tRNA(Gln) amidotransferase subunit GatC [Alphaproteobacteria bacterium]